MMALRNDPFADELDRLGPGSAWGDEGLDAGHASADDGWGEPDLVLLGTGRRPAPVFPRAVLGPWATWAETEAKAASAPIDYVGTTLLACAGAAIANVRWPLAGAGWEEPPILNIGNVGSPSSGKSPAMDRAFSLVRYAEDEMGQGFEEVRADHATRKQVADARQEAWRAEVKIAVKAGEPAPPMPADAVEPPAPVRPRIRVADATVEKLAVLAAGSPRGLLLVRDELAGFLAGLDRYSGGGSDRAFTLEQYGGRSYVVDRVKNPEPVTIRHLSIGILGGIQPEKLSGLIEGPDDGLTSRFLWCWPETIPDFRLCRETHDAQPMQAGFARLTRLAMAVDRYGNPEPKRLRLVPAAEDELEAFGRQMARRAHEASGLFAGTLGKARGHALRLAAIVDHLWFAANPDEEEPEEIGAPAIRAAILLMNDYFVPMAERVLGDAALPVPERRAMHLARYFRRTGLVEFNARDLRREVGGVLREAEHMAEACAALVEANLVRQRFVRNDGKRGRPAQVYEVNPVVFARAS